MMVFRSIFMYYLLCFYSFSSLFTILYRSQLILPWLFSPFIHVRTSRNSFLVYSFFPITILESSVPNIDSFLSLSLPPFYPFSSYFSLHSLFLSSHPYGASFFSPFFLLLSPSLSHFLYSPSPYPPLFIQISLFSLRILLTPLSSLSLSSPLSLSFSLLLLFPSLPSLVYHPYALIPPRSAFPCRLPLAFVCFHTS